MNKMNKKGFLTRDFVQAGILLTGIVALFFLMIGGIGAEYNNTDIVDEQFNSTYNRLSEVTDSVNTIRESTVSGEGLSFQGLFDVAFGAAFTAIQLVFSTLTLMGNVFGNFAGDFGISEEIASVTFVILFSLITVTLIFVWLSSISRGKF